MIRAYQTGEPERDVRFPEAMGLLLGVLTRGDSQLSADGNSQLSATDDSLIVSVAGKEILSFDGRGDDFERFKRFCFKIMPMVAMPSDKRREVVLEILRAHFEIEGKPIAVPLKIPNFDNKVRQAVQEALEERKTGEGARTHFERWFANFSL